MHSLLWLAATATPMPSSTVDPTSVTPGPWGFATIAVLAIAVVLLLLDMLRRVRRGRYRSEIREQLDAEAAAASEAADADAAATDAEPAATDSDANGDERPDATR